PFIISNKLTVLQLSSSSVFFFLKLLLPSYFEERWNLPSSNLLSHHLHQIQTEDDIPSKNFCILETICRLLHVSSMPSSLQLLNMASFVQKVAMDVLPLQRRQTERTATVSVLPSLPFHYLC